MQAQPMAQMQKARYAMRSKQNLNLRTLARQIR
jgi:hypothetical protein